MVWLQLCMFILSQPRFCMGLCRAGQRISLHHCQTPASLFIVTDRLHVFCCLQVATSELVLLFDLLELASSHANELNEVLEPVMASTSTLKLAFGPNDDLGKLAGSWPHIQAFRRPVNVLDLRFLWYAYAAQVSACRCTNLAVAVPHQVAFACAVKLL